MASGTCQKIRKLTVHQLLANCLLPNSQLTDVQQLFDSPISGEISWKLILENYLFNPLSANSDQHQFSPNNIHTLSRDKVMRINKMIIIEKIPWSFIKFSQLILKGDVWRSVWRICMWILGLKGLTSYNDYPFCIKLIADCVHVL